jgi:hypothetical protein
MTSPWLELLLLALLNTGGDAMSMGDGAHTPVVDVPLDESSGFPCGGFRGLHGHVCDEGEHQSPIDVHSGLAEPTSMHEAELSMHYPQYVTVSFDREAIPGGRWNVEPPHDAYVLLRGIKYHLVQVRRRRARLTLRCDDTCADACIWSVVRIDYPLTRHPAPSLRSSTRTRRRSTCSTESATRPKSISST